MSQLPYTGIRIFELSRTVAGRLTGLLFSDQGAEVFIERESGHRPDARDEYFDRGKIALPSGGLADTSSADVIIVDGERGMARSPAQLVLRITAAVPGDEVYGHLAADCSENLLNALVGFYTNMGTTSRVLGRPVIYTPLPLCSVYTGVNGAVAVAAVLADRERCGLGREIIASRLAGGVSAIGALALTSSGIADYLAPTDMTGIPEGVSPDELRAIVREASQNAARQLWLEQRLSPLAAPYRAEDGCFAVPLVAPNRRNTRKFCQMMGIWDQVLEAGMVDVSPYDPDSLAVKGRNVADSMSLNFPLRSKLADLLTEAFIGKAAAQWEQYFCAAAIPCVKVMSWQEWKHDPAAREARIWTAVSGHSHPQIGRSAWVASAQPYPDLAACTAAESLPARTEPLPTAGGSQVPTGPLQGFTVIDFTNVVAGPNCGRMFSELGATVYKVDPVEPQHAPTIMVTWAGEAGAGKRSIILDMKAPEGREIMDKLVAKSDMVIANKLDAQMERMGLSPEALDTLNRGIIGLQLSAHAGERRGPRHDYPGYDPAIQGTTGIMMRFGPEGCPTYHGVASCVDYLCGYLGVWAGVTALVARARRGDGTGDKAVTSLAAAATLTQCLLQQADEPASARGAYATGPSDGERVYPLADGWIFAQADYDMSSELAALNVDDAISQLAKRGIQAVPVQSCEELAARHRDQPTSTVNFERRERDGWENECFAPTWFVFDGKPFSRPPAAARIGSDAPAILAELGYSDRDIRRLIAQGIAGKIEWAPTGLGVNC